MGCVQELERQLTQMRATLVAEAGRLERHYAATQEQERHNSAEAAERLQKVSVATPPCHCEARKAAQWHGSSTVEAV